MTGTATLITQLRVLAHLTRTEAQVARLRVGQATGDDVRAELARNATDADGRAARITDVLRDLGALPDLVTPALVRVAALVRGAVEQAQPLDEALLADLALEHQLRERARYVAALAGAADLPAVRALADDLVAAHTETLRWLDRTLSDLAAGRPAALDATALQQVAAQVTRAANAPGLAPEGMGTTDTTGPTGATNTADTGAAADPADPAAGADPAAAADPAGAGDTTDTTSPAPTEPPIPGLADLPAHAAVAALRTLDDPGDVTAVLAFERSHGNRPAVLAAARVRAGALQAG